MSKAASANKAYRSPDSYRIYHHTIPAGKTVDGMAVDLYIQIGLFGLLLTALAYFTQPLRAEPAAPANTEIIESAAPLEDDA